MSASRRALVVCALAAAALASGSVAGAAVREVPQDFPTIQDAVDAANPGDTIAISKKKNFEHVEVATANLQIKGVKPGVVVDGYINATGDDYQFDINANGVRVVNMELRNGYGVYCNSSDGCAAKKVKFTGENGFSDCFYSGGDRAKVLNSTVRSCNSAGVTISGDDARVQRTTILRTDSGCIDIGGNDAVVTRNRMLGCEDDDGIFVSGDRALVENNFASGVNGNIVEISGDGARVLGNRGNNSSSECYFVNGDQAKVRNNRGSSCHDDGVDVSGDNPQITGNHITSIDGYGYDLSCSVTCGATEVSDNVIKTATEDDYGLYISVSGTGSALIARNLVSNVGDAGIYLSSLDDGRVIGNTVRFSANEGEDAFYVGGDDNTLRDNRAIDSGGDGFNISGNTNVVEDNLARLNSGDGFYVSGTDNQLLRNVATTNRADGFENDGTDTILRKNRASGSHRDCANDGTIAVKQGNKCADGSNFNQPGTASRIRR